MAAPTPEQIRQMALAMHRRLLSDRDTAGEIARRFAAAWGIGKPAPVAAPASLDFFDEAPAPAHWSDSRRAGASPDPRGRGPRHGAASPGRTR